MDAVAKKLEVIGAESVRVIALENFKRKPTLKMIYLASPRAVRGSKATMDASPKAGHRATLPNWSAPMSCLHCACPTAESKVKTPAKRAAKPKTDTLPSGFRLTHEGVFIPAKMANHVQFARHWKLARTRDAKGHNWGLLVEFDDPDGAKKRWNIPARTMTGDFGKDVLGPLVDMGLRLAGTRSSRNARNDLQSYFQGFDSAQRARLVTRLGWHDSAFLLPEQQVGSHTEHLHFYEAGAQITAYQRGWHPGAMARANRCLVRW